MTKKTKRMLSALGVLGILTVGTLSVQSYCDAKKQEAINKAAEASDEIYREDQMRIDSLQIQLEELQKKYNELNDKAYLDAEKVKWLEDDYNELLTKYNNLRGVSEQSQNTEVVETIASARGTAHRFEATAYKPGGLTAIGDPAEPGVIAVDPRVIPLGTYVYVEFDGRPDLNGTYKASDTGGAVKGNIIDVCMYGNLSAFGRRGCTVWY